MLITFLRDPLMIPVQRHRIFEMNISHQQHLDPKISDANERCIDREISGEYKQGFDLQMGDGDFLISHPVHVVHGSTSPDYDNLDPLTLACDAKRIAAVLYLHYRCWWWHLKAINARAQQVRETSCNLSELSQISTLNQQQQKILIKRVMFLYNVYIYIIFLWAVQTLTINILHCSMESGPNHDRLEFKNARTGDKRKPTIPSKFELSKRKAT